MDARRKCNATGLRRLVNIKRRFKGVVGAGVAGPSVKMQICRFFWMMGKTEDLFGRIWFWLGVVFGTDVSRELASLRLAKRHLYSCPDRGAY